MVNQNKNTFISTLETGAAHTGVLVMLAAVMISMAEVAERESHRVISSLQPAQAQAQISDGNPQQGHGDEQARRAKEEIRHTSATYGAIMRSDSISGTV